MKILSLISAFEPHVYGGAEISGTNLARWLAGRGHDVAVLTALGKDEQVEVHGADHGGLEVWRLRFPRPYDYWNHVHAPKWQKPLYYLQDHFDPRNRWQMAKALDAIKPDCVQIHTPSGIGYNALREIAKRNIPAVYHLHDLNLVCMWGGMFRNGRNCERQCAKCRCVSRVRFGAISGIQSLGFRSPSKANLETVARHLPIKNFQSAAILNANSYPSPNVPRTSANHLRFLYVGRLEPTKGITMLLTVLEELSSVHTLSIDILGDGSDAAFLSKRFGHNAWINFRGRVSQQDVANAMHQSDLVCVPSIWAEPLGGVVVQALTLGRPVFGSDIGGIPELIEHDRNGRIIKPGDAAAWKAELEAVLKNPRRLTQWGQYAAAQSDKFSQDAIAQRIEAFIERIAKR